MSKKNTPPPATPSPSTSWWPLAAGLLVLAFALLEIYGPALNGPFLFDDRYLPFLLPGFADNPLRAWVVGVRPILMVTYWANTRMFGLDPYWFHFVNLLLHAAAGVCVWYIAKKLTQHQLLSAFCALVFLLHPLQTESVSYIASRSEVAAGLFFLAAWAVFLYRKEQAIGVGESLLVMALYGMAVLTKEHTVVLIVVLLLTDYFFNPGFTLEGIKKNWKLYGGLLLAGIAPVLFLLRTLKNADSAGFNMKDLTATDYLLTQVRALWVYVRLYLLPIQQNLDYDMPISRSLFDYGAGLSLLSWLVLAAIAWVKRKQWPLASFGFFLFLVLLAPTSSFLPIRDVLVERRMYMAVFALSLIAVEFLRRWKTTPTTLAALTAVVSLGLMAVTYQRNAVWNSALALWSDSASKSPNKARPHFQLAYAHYEKGQCLEATRAYARAAELQTPDDHLYVDWALALDCAGQPAQALSRLEDANRLKPSAHNYSLMGMIRGKTQQYDEGLAALAEAEKLDPNFSMLHVYRGNILFARGELDPAIASFQKALSIEPQLAAAAQGLRNATNAKAKAQAQVDANRR
jgi:tetratricopeptide (TPR) repeat protein